MTAAKSKRVGHGALPIDEFVDELNWLLSFGTHPHVVARQLKMRPSSVQKRLAEHGLKDLAARFGRVSDERAAA